MSVKARFKSFFALLSRALTKRFLTAQTGKRRKKLLGLLSGSGIEIGALHQPCQAPHLQVRYVDRLNVTELRELYPELKDHALVEPDILDDAQELKILPDSSQDFVIANHVIEHMANPIKALLNWQRVLKTGGRLFMAVPDKRRTFDELRPLTTLEHLLLDYNVPSSERDRQHFEEFALYVNCRKLKHRAEQEHRELAKELWDKQYSIHYHVWDYDSFVDFLRALPHRFPHWTMREIAKLKPHGQEFIFVLERY